MKKMALGIWAAAALAVLVHLLALPSPSALARAFRLTVVDVVDRTGFDRPVVAARIAIPHDWVVAQSDVAWQVGNFCSALPVLIRFSAQSRDRQRGVDIHPAQSWYWDNMASINREFAAQMQVQAQMLGVPYVPMPDTAVAGGGMPPNCRSAAFTDAAEMLRVVGLGELRRGAVILDSRSRADLVTPDRRGAVQHGPTGIETSSREDVAEMLVGYSVGGQDYVEIMRGYVTSSQMTMPSMGMATPMVNGQGLGTIYGFHAPDGELDFALFEVIAGSVAIDPHWLARVGNVMTHNARVAQAEIAKRSAIIGRSNDEINDIIMRGYEERSRSMDRSAENFSNYLRGQQVFIDRHSGEQVRLPDTHRYNWRLEDGSYLLTDEPNFDPNVELGIGGRRLEVRR